jgi:hypothetical protein
LIDLEPSQPRHTIYIGLPTGALATLFELLTGLFFSCLLGNYRLKNDLLATLSPTDAANILTFQVGLSDDPVDRFLLSTGRTAYSLRIPEDCTV